MMRSIHKYIRKIYHFTLRKFGIKESDIFHFLSFIFAKRILLDKNRYLIIAPHPDDEVFGCAGLLHRLVRKGKNVQVVILTQGEALYNPPKMDVNTLIVKRRELALNAAKILELTAEQYTFLNWGDGKLHENQNKKELCSILETFKPEVVFIPHISDGSLDHFHATKIVTNTVHHFMPSIKLMYYCVWMLDRHSPYRLNWMKSYILTMNTKEEVAKSEAVNAYALQKDERGIPYSGYKELAQLPSTCRWKKELFFDEQHSNMISQN